MLKILCGLCAILSTGPTHAENGRTGLLGMRLSEAEKTDFFRWFHLRETNREKDTSGQTIVTFKPEGESVHEFVTLKVFLKDQEKIVSIHLILSRSFADDSQMNGVLARDISKSLLLDSIPESDQQPIHDLVDAIQSSPGNSHMIVLTKKPQKVTDPETPGYQAYLGNQQTFTKQLSSTVLSIENIDEEGAPVLEIKVSLGGN